MKVLWIILSVILMSGCKKKCPEDAMLYGEENKELVCLDKNNKIHGIHIKWYEIENKDTLKSEEKTEITPPKLFEKSYENGALEGHYKEYYPNGQLKVDATYQKGKINGVYKKYYTNGKVEIIANYLKGHLNAGYKRYYKNGKIMDDGNFNALGKKIGTWVYYRENGLKIREELYSEFGGVVVGRRLWKADGTPDAIVK